MSESVAVVLIVWASVIIPHVIEYFVWRKRFDAQFNDDREERSQHSSNCSNGERTSDERGTCHITDNGPWGYPYVCSACGASFDPDVNGGDFNYCPNCGKRVEVTDG